MKTTNWTFTLAAVGFLAVVGWGLSLWHWQAGVAWGGLWLLILLIPIHDKEGK